MSDLFRAQASKLYNNLHTEAEIVSRKAFPNIKSPM